MYESNTKILGFVRIFYNRFSNFEISSNFWRHGHPDVHTITPISQKLPLLLVAKFSRRLKFVVHSNREVLTFYKNLFFRIGYFHGFRGFRE